MYDFITDSTFHRKNKSFLFTNKLFEWRIEKKSNEYILKKSIPNIKLRNRINSNEFIGVVSPSNYRLIHDLFDMGVKKIYFPEFYLKGKRYKINKKDIEERFFGYLKRGYISYLNYGALSSMGLNRIEQFIVLGKILLFKSSVFYDNLALNKSLTTIKKVKFISEGKEKIKSLHYRNALSYISNRHNLSFEETSKILLQLYTELAISDPYFEKGFYIIGKSEENKEILDSLIEIFGAEYEYENKEIYLTDPTEQVKNKIVIKKLKENSIHLNSYLLFQQEKYFEGKVIYNKDIFSYGYLFKLFENIMPLKDFVLTLKSLIKMKRVADIELSIMVNDEFTGKLNIKQNINWLKNETWSNIYKYDLSHFSYYIEELKGSELTFSCPACGEDDFITLPANFICKNKKCGFMYDRLSLSRFGVKKISRDKFLESMQFNSVFVKNINNKNLVAFLQNRKSYFYLYLRDEQA